MQLWTGWTQTKQWICSWRKERIWEGEELDSGRRDNSHSSPKLDFSTCFQGKHSLMLGGFQMRLESTTEAYNKKWHLSRRISWSNSADFQAYLFLDQICLYARFIVAGWRQWLKMPFHHVHPALEPHLPSKLASKTSLLNTRSSLTLL